MYGITCWYVMRLDSASMIYTIDMMSEKHIFQIDIQMTQSPDLSVPQNFKKNSLKLLEIVFNSCVIGGTGVSFFIANY